MGQKYNEIQQKLKDSYSSFNEMIKKRNESIAQAENVLKKEELTIRDRNKLIYEKNVLEQANELASEELERWEKMSTDCCNAYQSCKKDVNLAFQNFDNSTKYVNSFDTLVGCIEAFKFVCNLTVKKLNETKQALDDFAFYPDAFYVSGHCVPGIVVPSLMDISHWAARFKKAKRALTDYIESKANSYNALISDLEEFKNDHKNITFSKGGKDIKVRTEFKKLLSKLSKVEKY